MYYPPYNSYSNYDPAASQMMREEKRGLKHTANVLCWTLLVAMVLTYGLIYVCNYYLIAIGYSPVNPNSDFKGYTPELYYLLVNVTYVMAIAVPPLIYFAVRHISLGEALPFKKAGAAKMAACVFLGSAICMLANYPANFVAEVQDFFGFKMNLDMPLTNDLPVLILYGIAVAVIPPIVEELLFRGMILHGLRKYGDSFAVVVSSILFGLFHRNFVQLTFAFFAGIALALVVVKTGSLWTSILIHFINNSISFALEMIERFAGDQAVNTANFIIVGVVIVFGLVSLIYLVLKDRSFFRLGGRNLIFPLGARIRAAFANPGAVALLIFTLAESVHSLYIS